MRLFVLPLASVGMVPGDTNSGGSVEHAQATDVGMRRSNNQDSYVVDVARGSAHWRERGHLFCVADGMGAHAAGEYASKIAVDNLPHHYDKQRDLSAPKALQEAVRQTNSIIHAKGRQNVEFHGMGTTCSALLLLPYGAVVAHVGDSRVYRLRGTTLEQLTFDHSLVWEMAQAGRVSEQEIPQYVPKNVITRSLGPHDSVLVDLEGPFDVEPDDIFMLCSDGLTGPVSNEMIGVVLGCLPPDDAAQTLIDLANLRGGPDNITAIVVKARESLSPTNAQQPIEIEKEEKEAIPLPPPPEPVHPVALAMAMSGSVAALIFSAMGHWYWMGGACAVAVAGLFWMLVHRSKRPGPPVKSATASTVLGKGPYRKYECEPNGEIVMSFVELVGQLREAAEEQEWELDWAQIDEAAQMAEQAQQINDHRGAILRLSEVVRNLMHQIRGQRNSSLGDSGIGL